MVRILIDPRTGSREAALEHLARTVAELLDAGKEVEVIVGESVELLSPQQAGAMLGFSRQHVRRLVDAGELAAEQLPSSRHWKIPLSSVAAFQERTAARLEKLKADSEELDRLGAPLE